MKNFSAMMIQMIKPIVACLLLLLASCSQSTEPTNQTTVPSTNDPSMTKTIRQAIPYEDCGEVIYNPDMGFYSVAPIVILNTSGINNKDDVKTYISNSPSFLKGISSGTHVYLKIANEDGNYPIKLANRSGWHDGLKANLIGKFDFPQ